MPVHQFTVNGTAVSVEAPDEVRLLWVLRDLLGITGPKHGCALGVCQACTSHINGVAFNPCAVPVGDLRPDDEITTIEGLADTWPGAGLHPVQEAWLEIDVAQCGFCQPGQVMTAVALVEQVLAEGRTVTDDDLDHLHNVCRCGTYPRIRAAIRLAAERMAAAPPAPAPVDAEAEGGAEAADAAPGREGAVAAAEPVAPAAGGGRAVRAAGAGAPAATTLARTGPATAGTAAAAAAAAGVAVAIRRAAKQAGTQPVDPDPVT